MNRRKMLTVMGGTQFWQQIKSYFGSSLIGYLRLVDPTGTTTLADSSGNNRTAPIANGAMAASTWIDGSPVPYFDGTTASRIAWVINMGTPFPRSEGAVFISSKQFEVANWTDSEMRNMFQATDGPLFYELAKTSNANQFWGKVGGKTIASTQNYTSVNWEDYVLTWSFANDRSALYRNGYLVGTQTGLSAMATAPATIYSGSIGGNLWKWKGYLANLGVIDREVTAAEALRLSYGNITKISCLGDSISANLLSYINLVRDQYRAGRCTLFNHAVSAQTIIDHMDTQTVAAASDNADIIIIELGTNDTETGEALTTEYQENVLELKASNPAARIYGMGILDKAGFGANETARSARIATACSNAGIPFWDVTGWIENATDTDDGTHPNATGNAKITAQILARI